VNRLQFAPGKLLCGRDLSLNSTTTCAQQKRKEKLSSVRAFRFCRVSFRRTSRTTKVRSIWRLDKLCCYPLLRPRKQYLLMGRLKYACAKQTYSEFPDFWISRFLKFWLATDRGDLGNLKFSHASLAALASHLSAR